jgi:hypothetical protein
VRLIDADAFDKVLKDAQTECKKNGGNFRFGVLGNVRANLAVFPTVDRPEIVRCKDCKNVVAYDDNEVICTHIDSNGNDKHSIDWFCADGERR